MQTKLDNIYPVQPLIDKKREEREAQLKREERQFELENLKKGEINAQVGARFDHPSFLMLLKY